MERSFNLIKNEKHREEKRVFPRFPFCFLTFKIGDQVFEIKDISQTGMQLALKDGGHKIPKDQQVSGVAHWMGKEISLQGQVKWTTSKRLGVKFENDQKFKNKIADFLSIDNIVQTLKPLHRPEFELELPRKLKYWLRADGPTEIFLWCHDDGEFSRFQFMIMDTFIEWEDGEGLQTGKVLSKRNVDTPLICEDEIVFAIENDVDSGKINLAKRLLESIDHGLLPDDVVQFLMRKMQGRIQ